MATQSGAPAVNQLGGMFLTEFYVMVDRWAQWATAVVQTWPEDPRQARVDPDVQARAVRLAESLIAPEEPEERTDD